MTIMWIYEYCDQPPLSITVLLTTKMMIMFETCPVFGDKYHIGKNFAKQKFCQA